MSDQTFNVLRRHGIQPAPKRSQNTTWREFIESHLAALAGIDFCTVEVAHLARVSDLLCVVLHPPGEPARLLGGDHAACGRSLDGANGAQRDDRKLGNLERRRYTLHDRDMKFCDSFERR